MKETAYTVAGFFLLAVMYICSYYAMITPDVTAYFADGSPKPEYRFGGEAAETFYVLAFTLDRQIRPERWPSRTVLSIDAHRIL